MAQSRTMKALDLVNAGASVASVAKKFNISPAAIYAAKARRDGKTICPCCEQVVRKGFKVKT